MPSGTSSASLAERVTDPDSRVRRQATPPRRDDTIVVEGARLGNFRLVHPLGDGGMGKVWLALHLGLRRHVALKVLHRDVHAQDEMRRRFEREAVAIGRLSHPGIVEALDFGELGDGRKFLAMEYVQGRTISEILESRGPLAWPVATRLIADVADALAFAHAHGVVHRDLKPDNLIVEGGQPATGRVQILDLGLARIEGGSSSLITEQGVAIGSASYSAPEQLRGAEIDARVDVYGLGAVLYRAITGQPPYPGAGFADVVLSQHRRSLTPPKEVLRDRTRPQALDALILKCLSHDRDDRPAGAAVLRDALREILRKPPSVRPTRLPAGLRAIALGAALIAFGAAAGILGAMLLTS